MRRAARKDGNERQIIEALEAIGCTVEQVGRPVDLLVGYRARNYLLECKDPSRTGETLTPAQKKFIAAWRGQVRIVKTVDEALEVVTKSYEN